MIADVQFYEIIFVLAIALIALAAWYCSSN